MRRILICSAAALIVAGCQRAGPSAPAQGLGRGPARYSGVGVYAPGPLWAQLAGSGRATDPAAATLEDDDEVIIVLDTATGELRQCGNLSGHCIAMDPWRVASDPSHAAPARLLKHAKALQDEAAATTSKPGA